MENLIEREQYKWDGKLTGREAQRNGDDLDNKRKGCNEIYLSKKIKKMEMTIKLLYFTCFL